jgi:hypothetical protein
MRTGIKIRPSPLIPMMTSAKAPQLTLKTTKRKVLRVKKK